MLQTHWRGAKERRAAGKAAAVMTRRLRTSLALKTSSAKTLAARTAAVMQHLQHGMQLNQVQPQQTCLSIACITWDVSGIPVSWLGVTVE